MRSVHSIVELAGEGRLLDVRESVEMKEAKRLCQKVPLASCSSIFYT